MYLGQVVFGVEHLHEVGGNVQCVDLGALNAKGLVVRHDGAGKGQIAKDFEIIPVLTALVLERFWFLLAGTRTLGPAHAEALLDGTWALAVSTHKVFPGVTEGS